MKKVYLDTNILVPLVVKDDTVEERMKMVLSALNILSLSTGIELCVSYWSLTELIKVCINDYSLKPREVSKIKSDIIKNKKVYGFDIEIINSDSGGDDYSIDDLFTSVGEIMNQYNPGWGDAIHCAIMRNNGIKYILSADAKDDFDIIPGIERIDPSKYQIE